MKYDRPYPKVWIVGSDGLVRQVLLVEELHRVIDEEGNAGSRYCAVQEISAFDAEHQCHGPRVGERKKSDPKDEYEGWDIPFVHSGEVYETYRKALLALCDLLKVEVAELTRSIARMQAELNEARGKLSEYENIAEQAIDQDVKMRKLVVIKASAYALERTLEKES